MMRRNDDVPGDAAEDELPPGQDDEEDDDEDDEDDEDEEGE